MRTPAAVFAMLLPRLGNEWDGTDKEFMHLSTADHLKWLGGTHARPRPTGTGLAARIQQQRLRLVGPDRATPLLAYDLGQLH